MTKDFITKYSLQKEKSNLIPTTIEKNGKSYVLCFTSEELGYFTYDWDEYCKVNPDIELLFENKDGDSYIIYLKGESIVGEFLNID